MLIQIIQRMTNSIFMKDLESDIDIIGPYPPPYGGISIHISRMVYWLRRADINYKILNQYHYSSENLSVFATKKSLLWWFRYLFSCNSKVIHFHEFSILLFPYIYIFNKLHKRKVKILTIHNEKILKYNYFIQKFVIYNLKKSNINKILAVSETVSSFISRHSIGNVEWLPAYVPPHENTSTVNNVLCGDNQEVIFNAWRIQNQDDVLVYGLDYLLRLFGDFPNLVFYIFIGDTSCKKFVETYFKSTIYTNYKLIFGEDLVTHLGQARLFLRLNRFDAYGISVQESLDLGVPAVASDVCNRASGCVLFKSKDYLSLKSSIIDVLSKNKMEQIKDYKQTNYHYRLLNIYQKLLNRTGP